MDDPNAGKGSARREHPDRTPLSVPEWRRRELPPRDYLLEGLLCSTSRWLLVGGTGVGKTLFSFDLAFAVALGRDFLVWKGVRPCRVMYLDGELPAETMQERINAAAELFGAEPPHLYVYNRDVLTDRDMPP